MNLVVPVGLVRFVFYNEINQEFKIHEIGESNYMRLFVPPNTWFGFQGVNAERSLVTNIADLQHDAAEVERQAVSTFDYQWEKL